MNSNFYDINTPKLLYPVDTIKIGEESEIVIGLYEKRKSVFYDVELKLKEKNIFIGRFNKTDDIFQVKYNDGKILVGYAKFIEKEVGVRLINVSSLYEIMDDTFYSCTEEEALKLFDKNLDSTYLKNKDEIIHRSDIEKLIRLK